ncbi:MAG: hypothetical protein COB36_11590 [Alphaproteobacteria bacterium]|nr:MAG: hypothetical protein COB36_11590 [Alphaproteobacteria bacterium]
MTKEENETDEQDFDNIFEEESEQPETVEAKTPEKEAETPKEETPPVEETPETAELEKAKVEEKPKEEVEAAKAAETPEPAQENGTIPVHVMTKQRDDFKQQLADRDAEIKRLQQQAQPQAAQKTPEQLSEEIPDPILDPEGFAKYQTSTFQTMLDNSQFKSRMDNALVAETQAGKTDADLMEEAANFVAAAKADKSLQDGIKTAHNPIQYVRDWNARQATQSELASYNGDLNAYVAAKVAEATGAAKADPVPAATAEAEPVIPRSIADTRPATTLPGAVETTADDDFEAIFS